jgi:hypothetical protein
MIRGWQRVCFDLVAEIFPLEDAQVVSLIFDAETARFREEVHEA